MTVICAWSEELCKNHSPLHWGSSDMHLGCCSHDWSCLARRCKMMRADMANDRCETVLVGRTP